ncbi:hypothetical protein CRU92_03955 [Arcobacter sp. FW59]|nr:hypothetical protein CRU92_03955 [Arcobacter sp. FW59]
MFKKVFMIVMFSSMMFANTQLCFIADNYVDSGEWKAFVGQGDELSNWLENVTENKINSCKVLKYYELEAAKEIVEHSPTSAFVLK